MSSKSCRVVSSLKVINTPGQRRLKARTMVDNNGLNAEEGISPSGSVPSSPRYACNADSFALAAAASMGLTPLRKAERAGVSSAPCGRLWNNGAPISFSKSRIYWLNGGWPPLSLSTGFLAFAIICAAAASEGMGRRELMFGAMILAAALNLAAALAPSWQLLLIERTAEGFVLGGVPAVGMTYLAEEIPAGQLGFTMGIYIALPATLSAACAAGSARVF
jgi:MFS family permease